VLDPSSELARLEAEKEALMRDIEEMKKHIAEGTTPSMWPRTMATPYGAPPYVAPSTEQEKEFLEQQRNIISNQIEAIKKHLEELEKGE
jgi:prefoldin subunit 5